jgi:protein-disulfide isomerase
MVERLLVGVIVILTILTTGILVLVSRNEMGARRVAVKPLRSHALTVDQWRQLTMGARLISAHSDPGGAPITIVEFSDFQCPACRQFSRTIAASRSRYPGRIVWVYRDYPLEAIHPQAMIAARAGVCAEGAGSFGHFYEATFDAQDSLARVNWPELARRAGVHDTARFASCLFGAESERRVVRERTLGDSIGVFATPTVVINGQRLSRPPTTVELDSILMTLR